MTRLHLGRVPHLYATVVGSKQKKANVRPSWKVTQIYLCYAYLMVLIASEVCLKLNDIGKVFEADLEPTTLTHQHKPSQHETVTLTRICWQLGTHFTYSPGIRSGPVWGRTWSPSGKHPHKTILKMPREDIELIFQQKETERLINHTHDENVPDSPLLCSRLL